MTIQQESYEGRERFRTIPDGWTEVPDSRHLSRRFDALVQVERANFERTVRIVEPGALVLGDEVRTFLLSDPGPMVFYPAVRTGNLTRRFSAGYALTFDGGFFRVGVVVDGSEPGEGNWHMLHSTFGARARVVAGAETFAAFADAEARGFSRDEVVAAFGSGGALDGARLDAVEVLQAHVGRLSGRGLAQFYQRAAESELVPGFQPADLGPLVAQVFEEELKSAVLNLDLVEVLALVKMTK